MNRLKLNFKILLLALTPFLFTSCFEVIEDVTVNANGSGKVALIVNLSQSKTKLKTIMLMDSINGYAVPSEAAIRKEFNNTIKTLKTIKGLSNIKQSLNFDDFIFKISCDFATIENLNQVVSHFSEMNNMKIPKGLKHFSYNKATKTFIRNYEYDLRKAFTTTKKEDRKVLEDASYVTIYRFQKDIISSTNKTAKIAKNNKAILLKVKAQDIINNTNTIKNTIKLN